MDTGHFIKHTARLVSQRNIFLLFSLVLVLVIFLLTTLLFFKKERTVVIPTTGSSFWLEDSKVSDAYLEKMGFFLADLILNRSPSDVERKNQLILQHVHPAYYHEIRKLLNQEKEKVLKEGHSFFFRWETHSTNAAKELFVLEGDSMVFIETKGSSPVCAQKQRETYTFKFHCENGKLQLIALKKEEKKP